MAIDVLSAMAMSAKSERFFSAAGRLIAWTRARLEGVRIEQLECLKHWQKSGLISTVFVLSTGSDSDGDNDRERRQQWPENSDSRVSSVGT